MIGGIRFDDQSEYVFFDPELRSRWHSVVDAFPDERVEFVQPRPT